MTTLIGSFGPHNSRSQRMPATASPAEKRMHDFLADTVHELRTPLTVIRGSTQFLLQRNRLNPGEVDALLAGIDEEASRLSRLIDNLLHLGRLDAGQPLMPRDVALSSFLDAFVTRYAVAWPGRPVGVDASRVNGAHVHVDPDALTRVLLNLVDNAARYSTSGSPILISCQAVGETVVIDVQDDGPGLEPEIAARLFERFYRGSTSRKHHTGGCGLGLAIVRALVEQSRGEISMETGPDRGTTVVVKLPSSD